MLHSLCVVAAALHADVDASTRKQLASEYAALRMRMVMIEKLLFLGSLCRSSRWRKWSELLCMSITCAEMGWSTRSVACIKFANYSCCITCNTGTGCLQFLCITACYHLLDNSCAHLHQHPATGQRSSADSTVGNRSWEVTAMVTCFAG